MEGCLGCFAQPALDCERRIVETGVREKVGDRIQNNDVVVIVEILEVTRDGVLCQESRILFLESS